MVKTSDVISFFKNPLVMVVVSIIVLIVVLAFFNLNMGFGVNANIGTIRGSFHLETFDNNNEPVFVLYYVSWCGHCKTTKPEFQKLVESYKGNVKVVMIDCEAPENKELVKNQKIKSYPTIRFYKNGLSGEAEEYSGERTYSNFVQYLGGVEGNLDKAPDNAAPF